MYVKLFLAFPVDDQDFTAKKETLEFAVYQKVVCTTVEILDDCVLEELEEFKVKLFITDTDSTGDKKEDKVKVDAGDSTVKIIDNQGKQYCTIMMLTLLCCNTVRVTKKNESNVTCKVTYA